MGHGPGRRMGFNKPKDMKSTLRKLGKYLSKYNGLLILTVIFILLSSVSMIAGSYFLKPLINKYIIPGDFSGMAKMLLLLAAIYSLGAGASFAYARIMVHISQSTVFDLRKDMFDKMQGLPLKFFDSNTHGDLMSRYTNDIDTISQALNNSLAGIISSVITFTGVIIMMIVLSPLMILVTAVMLFLIFFLSKIIAKKSKHYFSMQQAKLGYVNGYIEEMIEGQKDIKVFCYEEKAIEEFNSRNEELRKAATNAQTFAGLVMPVLGNMAYLNYAVTSSVGGILTILGILDIGTLVSYLQYTRQVSMPINHVSQQANMILNALAGAERIFDIMEKNDEVDKGKITLVKVTDEKSGFACETQENTECWAWKVKLEYVEEDLVPLKGDVKLENVDFSYIEGKPVLKNVSLFAKPGEKIAFVGSTGAGKTTITNLINRFYEIQSGKITYDGIDVREISKESLRRSLGIVLQDIHLFTGTVADNIRYGKLDASDEEVVQAAKLANAHEFIKHLPYGYETMLSGDGANLSQGQRQLISIARAAVADPPVLILDEATSSIDTRTEKLIEKGMDKLMEGRTVFVIAHRLSTIRNAKAILVLEDGRIIERGSHEDLLEQRGRYYQLYTGQAELN
ncbi:ABC transporter ATP-binding protein [Alkalibacter mobilis]|uniref:ABC transporter ATP-binding protein n=1 Tax=Alkalibacter mobilis TaxID=2787712 RepID=UPI00189F55DA|nr:ABC transporter ATP-binding protein [Alkalibacter mobilis]MBF7095579.1 ABC transporter ATP-binding protein [Alkalibacter mobilis]